MWLILSNIVNIRPHLSNQDIGHEEQVNITNNHRNDIAEAMERYQEKENKGP